MRQHRFSILMVAVLMVLLPATVLAQGIYRPCPDQDALRRTNRYVWNRYNINPIGPRELDRSQLGLVRVIVGPREDEPPSREKDLLLRTRAAMRLAVAKELFNVAQPNFNDAQAPYNRFYAQLEQMVENNEWDDSATDSEFQRAFECGSTLLDLPMAFGARVVGGQLTVYLTRQPPIVGFTPAPEAWVINPIRVEGGGPYAGRYVRLVIFKECFNLSGFFVPAPPPPPPPPPPPLRPATLTLTKEVINDNGGTAQVSDFPLFIGDREVVSGVAVTLQPGTYSVSERSRTGYTASVWRGDCDASGNVTLLAGENKTCTVTNNDIPPPPAVVPPFTLLVPKQWLDDDGDEVKRRPRGWQNVTFQLTDNAGTVIATGRLNEQSQIVFLNVPPETSSVRISEDSNTIPRGWLDRTEGLNISLTDMAATELRVSSPYVNQKENRPCRLLGMPCWLPPVLAGAGIAIWQLWPEGDTVVDYDRRKGGPGTPPGPGGSPGSTAPGWSVGFSVSLGGMRR